MNEMRWQTIEKNLQGSVDLTAYDQKVQTQIVQIQQMLLSKNIKEIPKYVKQFYIR